MTKDISLKISIFSLTSFLILLVTLPPSLSKTSLMAGGTRDCRYDNLWCEHWWQSWHPWIILWMLPSQWETTLHCNVVSHWLGTITKWSLGIMVSLGFQSRMIIISYTLSREYRVAWNRYSRLLFTSEDRFCTSFHVQEQSMYMMSQCQ